MVDAEHDGQVDALAGAEISTRLAPASGASPPSRSVKKPVHSSAMSTPLAACGRLAGSRSAVTWMRLPLMIRSLPSASTVP
jgi:hypothetical protein